MEEQKQILSESEFEEVLKKYVQIQDQEKQIAQEKQELKTVINLYLDSKGHNSICIEMEECPIRVTKRDRIQVSYNEELLKERLGENYQQILGFDAKKAKKNQQKLSAMLGDHWPEFASPDRGKVKHMIENGILDAHIFQDAFEKKVTTVTTVSRVTPKLKNPPSAAF